jgi:transcriptional regulator with XRE-family HTH domain
MTLAQNLFDARDAAGLTWETLAKKGRMNRTTIYRAEKGECKPRKSTLRKWAKACKTTVEALKR